LNIHLKRVSRKGTFEEQEYSPKVLLRELKNDSESGFFICL
jgi:hypothetical protein